MVYKKANSADNRLLTVHQIYYDESQISKLESQYIPYKNEDCTVFFENEVIAKLITSGAHLNGDYFGVVSHKLREKIYISKTTWRGISEICNTSNQQFTPELFESELIKHRPDVMSFSRHMQHDPISFADRFHPEFTYWFKYIMPRIGYNWQPEVFKDVFYCNFFVAKSEIYEDYVKKMLIPAMEVMKTMPGLMNDSRYPHSLPGALQEKFGVPHYTYHTFLLERMFSYYAHINKLNCLHF